MRCEPKVENGIIPGTTDRAEWMLVSLFPGFHHRLWSIRSSCVGTGLEAIVKNVGWKKNCARRRTEREEIKALVSVLSGRTPSAKIGRLPAKAYVTPPFRTLRLFLEAR